MRRALLLLLLCSIPLACVQQDDHIDLHYDICSQVVVAPAADALPAEAASVDEALALWHAVGMTQLVRGDPDAPGAIVVRFEKAMPAMFGYYDDEAGVVLVNRNLKDPVGRAITVAHELGHAFGLEHVPASVRQSVMNKGNLSVPPKMGDLDALHDLWGACPARDLAPPPDNSRFSGESSAD